MSEAANASLKERVRELRLSGKIGGAKAGGGSSAWFPWVLCLMLAGAWASFGVRWYRNPPASSNAVAGTFPGVTNTPKSEEKSTTAPAVTTGDTSTNSGKPADGPGDAIRLEVRGYIIPAHQISISPVDVAGRLINVWVEEGKKFNEGDPLAEIDSTSFRADYLEAVAQERAAKGRLDELLNGSRREEVFQAEAELAEAQAMTKQSELEFRRSRDLRSGALSPKEVEIAEANYEAGRRKVIRLNNMLLMVKEGPRKERIEVAKAEYEAAKARRDKADFRLKNCVIKAPVTGIILTKKAERGNLINPVVGGVSTSLCEMANLAELEVDLEVQERDLPKIFVGQECRVRADAFQERVYSAYIDRMMPIANRAKGILPVRVRIILREDEEQGKYLKPEMGVITSFLSRESAEYRKIKDAEKKPVPVVSPVVPPAEKPAIPAIGENV